MYACLCNHRPTSFTQVSSSETLNTVAAVEPVIPVKPVYTPEVSAVDTLIELLRESLKVMQTFAVISLCYDHSFIAVIGIDNIIDRHTVLLAS